MISFKKLMFILMVLFLIHTLNAERTFLYPEKREVITEKNRKKSPVPGELESATRGELIWLLEDQCGSPGYPYQRSHVDTFLTWFKPPAKCTVIAYRTLVSPVHDTGQRDFSIFFANLVDSIDYAGFPEYHSNGYPSSYAGFYEIIDIKDTVANTGWEFYTDSLDSVYVADPDGKFGMGFIKAIGDSSPNIYNYNYGVEPYHQLVHDDRGHGFGWYTSYHAYHLSVLINCFENPPPELSIEDLPDTYSTDYRGVNIRGTDFGVPSDSSGIQEVFVDYRVNSWNRDQISGTLFSGDSSDGYWRVDIPPGIPGDTVEYRAVAVDFQGRADTSGTYSYIIREGEEGDMLWVEGDYTGLSYPGIFSKYSGILDVWDIEEYGIPDSSVITFYSGGDNDTSRTIIWKCWGGEGSGAKALGAGVDLGAGILHSDSSYLKEHLEQGGNLLLSDQDQGYSIGVTPDYGQVSVTGWARNYLGIEGISDDDPQVLGMPLTLYSSDSVFSGLFSGAGNQTAGEIFVAPYYALTGGSGYAYTAVFDSILSYAVPGMVTVDGDYVAYRLDGEDAPGSSPVHNGKVVNFGFPFEYVANPFDSLVDTVGVDTLFEEVLGWFGVEAGAGEHAEYPEEVIKLYPVKRPVTGNLRIRFYLPERVPVKISLYDCAGREVREVINRTVDAGLNIEECNVKVSAGIYFCRMKADEWILSEKVVVLE